MPLLSLPLGDYRPQASPARVGEDPGDHVKHDDGQVLFADPAA